MLGGLKIKSVILAIFSLILLAPLLNSQVNWAVTEADLYMWTLLAIAICAAFIGMAYMAARLLEIQVLEAWVKIELQELVASALIAVFCVALIASVNGAAQFLVEPGGSGDIVQFSRDFLRDSIYADGQAIYGKLGTAYFNTAKVASYSYVAGISIGVASFSKSESPAAGLSPLVSELGQGMDSVANFMLLASAQSAFLGFFASASALMLPLGIFLRSFSLTRKIGGTVLAAVIASAVLYPAAFTVSKEVYNTFRGNMMDEAANINVKAAENPPSTDVVCHPWMQRFVQSPLPFLGGEMGWWLTVCSPICALSGPGFFACMSGCYGVVSTIFYIIKSIFPIIIYIATLLPFANELGSPGKLLDGYLWPVLDHALPAVAKFVVLSLVVFLIPLIFAMVMLRNLAITFGGEPQLYGISKLV